MFTFKLRTISLVLCIVLVIGCGFLTTQSIASPSQPDQAAGAASPASVNSADIALLALVACGLLILLIKPRRRVVEATKNRQP